MTVAIIEPVVGELQLRLREQLADWQSRAMELWELTAAIGATIEQAYRSMDYSEWREWLGAEGLSPYVGFCFMRATKYPELMREHQPGSLEKVRALLPQGQGTAFDAEMARTARTMHEAGMPVSQIRVHFAVSRMTVKRWVDPDGWERDQAKKRERAHQLREEQAERKRRELDRLAKAEGGPVSVSYGQVRKAAQALQVAMDAEDVSRERRAALRIAMEALHRCEDEIGKALRA